MTTCGYTLLLLTQCGRGITASIQMHLTLGFLTRGAKGLFRLTMVEKAQLQEHEIAGHIASAVRKQLTGSEVARL